MINPSEEDLRNLLARWLEIGDDLQESEDGPDRSALAELRRATRATLDGVEVGDTQYVDLGIPVERTFTYQPPAGRLCSCGAELVPTAHHTGDGWTWGGECLTCGVFVSEQDESKRWPWPFKEDTASADDWRRAGYVVV